MDEYIFKLSAEEYKLECIKKIKDIKETRNFKFIEHLKKFYIDLFKFRCEIILEMLIDLNRQNKDEKYLIQIIHEEEKQLELLKREFCMRDDEGIRGVDNLPMS
jgi:hypothetical protein